MPAWILVAFAVLTVGLLGLTLTGPDDTAAGPGSGAVPTSEPTATLEARWVDGDGSVSANGVAQGSLEVVGDVPDGTDLALTLDRARFLAIPDGCGVSTATVRLSWLSGDSRTLHCSLLPGATLTPSALTFRALVDALPGTFVSGDATLGQQSARLPERPVVVGARAERRQLRLLSSPDFLNADVADLTRTRGQAHYDPLTETNGITGSWQTALDTVFTDWVSRSPDLVTVAGDEVEGHWFVDKQGVRVFGPVRTLAQQRAAIRRAGNTYYSQWLARFRQHGLDVYPAMGDHEYGDNYWPTDKLDLASTYRAVWAEHFTKRADGRPRFSSRPQGQHEFSAYAWRPRPDVQMVSLDEFTQSGKRMLLKIDDDQLRWLDRVLAKAKADGVRWTIVQGHMPILGPVRQGSSSGLMYSGGRSSALWKTFKKYGVDMYLCGEVHDVTAIQKDGVLQLSHGGVFQFGRTNYLLADVYDNHLDLKVYDYTFSSSNDEQVWQTRHPIPGIVDYAPDPAIIGTAQLWQGGHRLSRVSGALAPYRP